MTYIPVLIYDLDGNPRGHSILNHEANKLKTTNVWTDEELPHLQDQLDRLNVDTALKQHWPQTNDPEVLALLNDPNWEPFETHVVDVVDDERSHYVYHHERHPLTGEIINGEVDREASVIAYKKARVPVRPIDAQIRTKKAHEIVARRRAGM